ncbi:MAG: TonB-dependent receptor domain-containing protein, partial [Sandarakinorhabdus sp.]
VNGIDFNLDYQLRTSKIGTFSINVNAAKLINYQVVAPAPVQALLDAQKAGKINAGVPILGGGDVVGIDGQPRWRLSANVTWSLDGFTVGAFTQFVDDVVQNAVRDANAKPFPVNGQTTVNLFLRYAFERDDYLKGTAITVGARNIFDKDPPLASTGYLSNLYAPIARYWSVNVSKSF